MSMVSSPSAMYLTNGRDREQLPTPLPYNPNPLLQKQDHATPPQAKTGYTMSGRHKLAWYTRTRTQREISCSHLLLV